MQDQSSSAKSFLAVMALLGWFALIAQFYLNMNSGVAEADELVIRFFSYFTTLTNLLVALCCTTLLFRPHTGFFSKQTTRTAIAVYIVVVGIVYNCILRFLWAPQGLQRIVDELLHLVIPLLFLIYWLFFVEKKKLSWTSILPWMAYPLAYLIFALIRGLSSGFYPYPFLDVDQLGFKKVLINSVGITAIFFAISLLFVWIGNRRNRGFLHD